MAFKRFWKCPKWSTILLLGLIDDFDLTIFFIEQYVYTQIYLERKGADWNPSTLYSVGLKPATQLAFGFEAVKLVPTTTLPFLWKWCNFKCFAMFMCKFEKISSVPWDIPTWSCETLSISSSYHGTVVISKQWAEEFPHCFQELCVTR